MTPVAVLRSRQLAGLAGALCAIAIGAAAAIVSSPQSFSAGINRDLSLARPAAVVPSPTPSPTGPAAAGKLGDQVNLLAGAGWLLATGTGGTFESDDGGSTWQSVSLAAGLSGLVIDPANPAHRLAGGNTLAESHDAGKSWTPSRTQPPGPGPFTPLAINPTDPAVWFVTAHGALLRTRDSAVSWRSMTGLPRIASPVLTPEGAGDRFSLSVGGRNFDLLDNGNQINEMKPLPAGVTATQVSWLGTSPALIVRGSDGKLYIGGTAGWAPTGATGFIAAVPSGTAWVAAGGGHLGAAGKISFTSDGGATWVDGTGLPQDQSVEAVAALPPNGGSLIAYAYGGDLYSSTDAGQNWALLSGGLRSP
ncbi:MAG TPA: YCF48-related protein [Candidatus Dormibacteraeota bacterium]